MEVELNQLDASGRGARAARAARVADSCGRDPDPGASASRRVGVGATEAAALMEAALRFGTQGEGAIEGVVGDHRRVALDAHAARFALFGWCRGGGENAK